MVGAEDEDEKEAIKKENWGTRGTARDLCSFTEKDTLNTKIFIIVIIIVNFKKLKIPNSC